MSESSDPDPEVRRVRATVRRAPSFKRFALTGAVFGTLVALVIASQYPDPANYSATTVYGYFGAIGFLVGGLAGSVVAVLLDRTPRRGTSSGKVKSADRQQSAEVDHSEPKHPETDEPTGR